MGDIFWLITWGLICDGIGYVVSVIIGNPSSYPVVSGLLFFIVPIVLLVYRAEHSHYSIETEKLPKNLKKNIQANQDKNEAFAPFKKEDFDFLEGIVDENYTVDDAYDDGLLN